MARPKKTGLDYFSLDTKFDEEFESFVDECGNAGLSFMIRFWQMAYRTEKGEIDMSEMLRKRFLKLLKINDEELEKIIFIAASLKLVDKNAYKTKNILTSTGIKKRISIIFKERKESRERIKKTRTYNARNKQELFAEQLPNNSEQFPNNSEYGAESKVKERKVKEKKRKVLPSGSITCACAHDEPSRSFSFLQVFSQEQIFELQQKIGDSETQFWIDEVQAAYERNPEKFLQDYKNPVAVATSWRRRKLADGFGWDEITGSYKKPTAIKHRLAEISEIFKKLEKQENVL